MTNPEPENSNTNNVKRMIGVSLSAGCLSIVVAGIFILIGFLIDRNAGTGPRWMLILLFVSMPFSLGGAYLIAQRAIKRAKAQNAPEAAGEIVEGRLAEEKDEEEKPQG